MDLSIRSINALVEPLKYVINREGICVYKRSHLESGLLDGLLPSPQLNTRTDRRPSAADSPSPPVYLQRSIHSLTDDY